MEWEWKRLFGIGRIAFLIKKPKYRAYGVHGEHLFAFGWRTGNCWTAKWGFWDLLPKERM